MRFDLTQTTFPLHNLLSQSTLKAIDLKSMFLTPRAQRFALNTILLLAFSIVTVVGQESSLYLGSGNVSFVSNAPLETITAKSSELKGVLDLSNSTFAFSFQVSTFEGFNSPLQQEHFNEHYLETSRFPKAAFTGNMIGRRPCNEACDQEITARGKMTIHGITKVISIPVRLKVDPQTSELHAEATFEALLEDYGIDIPLILAAKISPEILVSVSFDAKLNGND